jgi:hypothetical protein
MENTGYKVGRDPLFVGDILSHYSGYDGFYEIQKIKEEYWVVNCSAKVWGHDFPEEEIMPPFKLERNLGPHWTKVDKNNPTKVPPMPVYCNQCDAVITGYFDVDTGETTYTEECSKHTETVDEEGFTFIESICKLCEIDSTRTPPRNEVMEYFAEQYKKAKFQSGARSLA